jgi:hypothetical protein
MLRATFAYVPKLHLRGASFEQNLFYFGGYYRAKSQNIRTLLKNQ